MIDLGPEDKINRLTFHKQPNSINTAYRPMYRIVEILLTIKYCSIRKSLTILKLQLVGWISHDPIAAGVVQKLMDRQSIFQFMHIDPAVNLAVDYALGSGLIELTSTGRLKLTPVGDTLLTSIEAAKVMIDFIARIRAINLQIKDLKNDQL